MNKIVGVFLVCMLMAGNVRGESELGAPITSLILSGGALATTIGIMSAIENWLRSDEGSAIEKQIAHKALELAEAKKSLAMYNGFDSQRASMLLRKDRLKAELRLLKGRRPIFVRIVSGGAHSLKPARIGFWAGSGAAGIAMVASALWVGRRGAVGG